MKEKIDIDNLYVVCRVSEVVETIEPWVQYETFGKDIHHFFIKPKMYLTKKEGEKYTIISSGEEIKPIEPKCSYASAGSCRTSLRYYAMPEIMTGGIINIGAKMAYQDMLDDLNQYGYVMPFKEYVKNVLGIELTGPITVSKAQVLLALINKRGKAFELSQNEEVAEEQIQKRVRRSK